jgi:type III pantothenate kinase
MNLIIDQGNTSTKCAVVSAQGDVLQKTTTTDFDAGTMLQLLEGFAVQAILVCSVRHDYEVLKPYFEGIGTQVVFFDDDCRLPFTNLYATPKTLGKDRIAGVCGALKYFAGQNCLVIDAGTCITYDFIDAEKKYYGGSISPGLEMRLKAMQHFTGKLPLAPLEWPTDFVGNSTQTALQTGAVYGTVNEINGFIARYKQRHGLLQVLMCGGDTDFLAKRCESEIFAASDLVITGLNEILIYNLPHVA